MDDAASLPERARILSSHFKRRRRPRGFRRTFLLLPREVGSRMTFPFTCSACGFVNHFGWSQIGQKIACDGCEKSMTVPVPMEAVGPATSPPRATTFRCPSCRRKFSTKPEMAGKKIRCNGCGAGVRVPEGDQESVGQTSRTGANCDSGTDEDNAPAQPARGSVRRDRGARGGRRRCDSTVAAARRARLDRDGKAPQAPRVGPAVASRVDGTGPAKSRRRRGRQNETKIEKTKKRKKRKKGLQLLRSPRKP